MSPADPDGKAARDTVRRDARDRRMYAESEHLHPCEPDRYCDDHDEADDVPASQNDNHAPIIWQMNSSVRIVEMNHSSSRVYGICFRYSNSTGPPRPYVVVEPTTASEATAVGSLSDAAERIPVRSPRRASKALSRVCPIRRV
jgi:hypothetical protein